MQARREADGVFVLIHYSTLWTKWLLGAAVVFLATAGYDVFIGPRGADRLIGLLAAAGTCILAGVVSLEKTCFRFDPVGRVIVWDRRWALRRRTGSAAFGDVRSVLVEVPIGDEGVPSRRVCLQMTDGIALPITVGFRPDADGSIAHAAEQLREILGHPPDPSLSESVQALVAGGRIVDAIRLLREQAGLSLADAKSRVDAMRASGKRRTPHA